LISSGHFRTTRKIQLKRKQGLYLNNDDRLQNSVQRPRSACVADKTSVRCNEDNEQQKWRYGVHDEDWRSDLYDSVEEFLNFYAHFNEQTEEGVWKDIRSLKGILGKR
jgi:hypothetical protein